MKIKDIKTAIKADPKKGIKAQEAEKFTTLWGDKVFIITNKTKDRIEFKDINTGKIYVTTPNDCTNFFIVE